MKWIVIGKEEPGEKTGGLNRYVEGYVPALKAVGESVETRFFGTPGSGSSSSASVRMLRAFADGFRISDADVIDVHFAMYGMPYLVSALSKTWAFRRRRPRVVIHFHGPWGDESAVAAGSNKGLSVWAKRGMERWALSRADTVIVLTETFAREAVRAGARSDAVVVISPGVDDVWGTVSRRIAPGSDKIDLLCVRRLTARMGHEALIRALHEVGFTVDGRAVRLHIVGVGELQQELTTLSSNLGREQNVLFHGRLSDQDLRDLGASCSAAVVPTLALEGFGLVVLEAMAMGLPVISTGQGGLSTAMGPWARHPFIFSLYEPTSLVDAISSVMPEESPDLASEVKSYASAHTWSKVAHETVVAVSA
ncbi:glycosyltransferase family 4 protein [Microbacterium sp. PRF11]|uniref:glycosyltransferase family 4 protein n=1 Tax=Microbacterium sp. PRF11 TaxID=2962593 RepID=UPI0028820690|nr:glycosyltransferase family 4 protein [Microbacterium sp. PRF11]MDT0117730.1 glycosyltransferase family 4 protein [Microbacterium sp. PRF11]